MLKLVINSAEGLVAVIENYDGPVPRAGDYIFRPPLDDDGVSDLSTHGNNVMSVKTVTWGIIMRPPAGLTDDGPRHFTGRHLPMVEVWV